MKDSDQTGQVARLICMQIFAVITYMALTVGLICLCIVMSPNFMGGEGAQW